MGKTEIGSVETYLPLSPTDFHLLLVLSERESYGYELMKAMEAESGGVIAPEIGSLYRMLARLADTGLCWSGLAGAGELAVVRGDGATPLWPREKNDGRTQPLSWS